MPGPSTGGASIHSDVNMNIAVVIIIDINIGIHIEIDIDIPNIIGFAYGPRDLSLTMLALRRGAGLEASTALETRPPPAACLPARSRPARSAGRPHIYLFTYVYIYIYVYFCCLVLYMYI